MRSEYTNPQEQNPENENNSMIIRLNGRWNLLLMKDVVAIKANGQYSELLTDSRLNTITIPESLGKFLNCHRVKQFYRCHRSYAFNLHKVKSFCSKSRIINLGGIAVPIARRYLRTILTLLLENGYFDMKPDQDVEIF